MLDGPSVAKALKECSITHVIWVPDSAIGPWEAAFKEVPGLSLIRVCREGEAFAVAAGLLIGGKKPIVMIQCTGLFEAGDSLRNIVHDLKLPIFFLTGIRSYFAHQEHATTDSCPVFTEPIMQAWRIPYKLFDREHTGEDLAFAIRQAETEKCAGAVLLAEGDP